MKTLYTTNYRGFIIRVREASIEKDGYFFADTEKYVAEGWIYRPEIDCEELDGANYGPNMMKAVKNSKSLIDIMLNNGRKI
jgi:hypothetical protein